MELMPMHSQRSYSKRGNALWNPLPMSIVPVQSSVHKLQELCKLPELEITPVAKSSDNKSIAEGNARNSRLDVDTSRDRNSKEKSDMENLLKRLPILNQFFQLHNKIGEGTFSTVYLATLRNSNCTKSYAVKHLTQNFQQLRIEEEFRCMTQIGGKDNVVHVDYCLTSGDDCVTFIMPYLPHKKFSDYVLDMNADETRLYMKNLFIALRRVHSFNVIHRDVKPGNFLYNRETKQFLLVDFGLAQIVQNRKCDGNKVSPTCDENVPLDYSKKRKRKESADDREKTPVKRSRRMALKLKDNNVKLAEQESENFGSAQYLSGTNSASANNTDKLSTKSSAKNWCHNTEAEPAPLKERLENDDGRPSAWQRDPLEVDGTPATAGAAECQNTVKTEPRQLRSPSTSARPDLKGAARPGSSVFAPLLCRRSTSGSFAYVRNGTSMTRNRGTLKPKISETVHKFKTRNAGGEQCSCSGKGAICAVCSSRSKMIAPRAGTPGFRPPEVLFKHLDQTTAVDMWASGVILLCILSGCYPFFNSPNDLVALAEIMTVFGTEPVIKIAAKFGRRVVCSNHRKGVDLKKLCKILRARASKRSKSEKKGTNEIKCEDCSQPITKDGCLCISSGPTEEERKGDEDTAGGFPDSAFHLLQRLLDLDPTTRITAAEALEHPFISGQ